MSSDAKLDLILQDLNLIKNHLKIVPDKDSEIIDLKSSISEYETYAKEELKLNAKTITNQLSTLSRFLHHCNGIINKESVKSYLDTNESDSWKSNQIKALRRYIRDYLKLGNWIESFEFSKTKAKIKHLPSDQELLEFVKELKGESQIAFLLMYTSGLRIGEIVKLKVENLNFEINSIDASEIHDGDTKHSWVSFFTTPLAKILQNYIEGKYIANNENLFSIESRTIQNNFKLVSEKLGIELTPHVLRSVFTEKCTVAKISDKYIDALCGRTSPSIIAKHYTDYSPQKLRLQYNLVEPLLTL
ncbi:MAG: site-specific integrase [Nitrosopumilus sp.]|nr:site-specific integrase [Nitrosopumilus sp.]